MKDLIGLSWKLCLVLFVVMTLFFRLIACGPIFWLFSSDSLQVCAMILIGPHSFMKRRQIKKNQQSYLYCGYQLWRLSLSTGLSLSSFLNNGQMMGFIVTTIVSLILTALSLSIFWTNLGRTWTRGLWHQRWISEFLTKPIFTSRFLDLALMIGIATFCANASEPLMRAWLPKGLNQADSKMQVTRAQVDNATAKDYTMSQMVWPWSETR